MAFVGQTAVVGIIGGTGIYGLKSLENVSKVDIDTPFGKPSSEILLGTIEGLRVAFISRHDINHHLLPSEIPYRANIYALKVLGVKYVLSFGAVGSLKEEYAPGDIVVVDQYIDRTRLRNDSFFGNGVIVHVSMGIPTCPKMTQTIREVLAKTPLQNQVKVHNQGTYVCIEGPSFSSRAESRMYQLWGGSVIGMTALPEMKLCREAEMAYGLIACVTDYDSWRESDEVVTVDMVKKILKQNGENAQTIIEQIIRTMNHNQFHSEIAHNALEFSLLTPIDQISPENKRKLYHLLKRYLGGSSEGTQHKDDLSTPALAVPANSQK